MNKQCINCKFFDRSGTGPGKRPGVRDNYRKCKVVRQMNRAMSEWRSPTDSCNLFEPAPAPVDPMFKTRRKRSVS